jgi:hypothetical protein
VRAWRRASIDTLVAYDGSEDRGGRCRRDCHWSCGEGQAGRLSTNFIARAQSLNQTISTLVTTNAYIQCIISAFNAPCHDCRPHGCQARCLGCIASVRTGARGGLVKNKVGFVSLGMGEMYVKRKSQVVIFFWKGDGLGLRVCHQMTCLTGMKETIVPAPTPYCTAPSRQGQLRPQPVQVQEPRQIRGQDFWNDI